jgi:TPP-dependent pyruvate/acetoin dehydrogenase alpha subunit
MAKIRKTTAPTDDSFALISNQKLLALYAAMVCCRKMSQNGCEEKPKRAKRSLSRLHGHEAAAVGAAIDLRQDDTVAAPHWPEAVLRTINPSVTVASKVSLASSSNCVSHENHDVTILFADGNQSAQSAWQKTLTRLAAQNLPVLLISLTTSPSFNLLTAIPKPRIVNKDYELPSIAVDGCDVMAMYRVASEAIVHARKGNGPTLIECFIEKARDPIRDMEQYLMRKGLLDA